MTIHQDQVLQLRQHAGIPQDQMPVHVTGGIPIQQYLQSLLERAPDLPLDPALELVSAGVDPENLSESRSTVRSDSQLNDSDAFRQAFLHDYVQWTNRHVRVKVNIPNVDRPCYVWQSILEVSSDGALASDSGEEVAPHELNIQIPEGVEVAPPADPVPDHGPVQDVPADMFRRYVLFQFLDVYFQVFILEFIFLGFLLGCNLNTLVPIWFVLVNIVIICVNWSPLPCEFVLLVFTPWKSCVPAWSSSK